MEDDCGAQRAAGWPCSPSEEWVALWAKGIAPALSDATCHSAVRRRPSCSNTVDMLREKLREEEGDVGTPRAGGYGSCRGGTTRRGGGVAFAQRLASLSLLTVRLGQGRLSAMKEVNRRHFALGHHADWLRVLPG